MTGRGNTRQQAKVHERRASMRVLSLADLRSLPDPSWRIEGILHAPAVAAAVGAPGEGKTFLSLDMALSVATGQEWLGRATKRGPVLYIAAEGATGMRDRVEAWLKHRGIPESELPEFWVMPDAVELTDNKQVEALEYRITSLPVVPVLIVIDTLAQCFTQGDENSANDMGRFMRNARRLQRTGATVLIVHHTTKSKGKQEPRERGSGALRGAVDAMIGSQAAKCVASSGRWKPGADAVRCRRSATTTWTGPSIALHCQPATPRAERAGSSHSTPTVALPTS